VHHDEGDEVRDNGNYRDNTHLPRQDRRKSLKRNLVCLERYLAGVEVPYFAVCVTDAVAHDVRERPVDVGGLRLEEVSVLGFARALADCPTALVDVVVHELGESGLVVVHGYGSSLQLLMSCV
tara:strand:+ start:219 stop:587 length:369 start_codon:yes stop_codon:yes gene_type:complete